MAAHSSILARTIPWTEQPGGLQSMGIKESDTAEQVQSFKKVCISIPSFFFSFKQPAW